MSEESIKDKEQEAVASEGTAPPSEAAAEEVIDGVVEEVVDSAETETDAATEEAPEPPTIEEKLATAEALAAQNLEGWQRAVAELANARKRFTKQRADARANATIDVVSELLPILDDLSLAMANVPAGIADDDWYGGFSLIPRKITNILEGIKIEKVEAVGQPFDPIFHNAIMQEETEEFESGIVIREYQTGYKMGDRIVRPAVVAVAA